MFASSHGDILLPIGFPRVSAAEDDHTGKLMERAKKETSLVWYTSTGTEDIKRLFVSSMS
jgi:hypothetical protein